MKTSPLVIIEHRGSNFFQIVDFDSTWDSELFVREFNTLEHNLVARILGKKK